jgi:hypothetical protein
MGNHHDSNGTSENVNQSIPSPTEGDPDSHFRYPQLVGARVCLGFAEAGLFPGVIY